MRGGGSSNVLSQLYTGVSHLLPTPVCDRWLKILIPSRKQHAIIANNMPLAEPQTWNAYQTGQNLQAPQVPFYGRRGQRGNKQNCNTDD